MLKNNRKFFSGNIIKCCGVCAKGVPSKSLENVFCERFGVMMYDDCCKHFDYEPLRRIPKPITVDSSKFSPEDFKL